VRSGAFEVNSEREVRQGDVFWVRAEALRPSVPGAAHPHVVIQADVLNRARIASVVVCALTSNLKRAEEPGNVLLEAGEANLPRQSVAVVSQVSTVDKAELGEHLGRLSNERVEQILSGMSFQQKSFFER
jgi:mRNA interferase MazF